MAAARLAVAVHLQLDEQEKMLSAQQPQARVGGADQRVSDQPVTEDRPASVVSGPLP